MRRLILLGVCIAGKMQKVSGPQSARRDIALMNILTVNEKDEAAGYMDKLLVHRQGILHRAFSVLLFNSRGCMLLQKRGAGKYHSALLWTNACCSHQGEGETLTGSVERRLQEELRVGGVKLDELFTLSYRCSFENGLIENEIDHVFGGNYDGDVKFDPLEIEQIAWVDVNRVREDMANGGKYTYWFRMIMDRLCPPAI
jgi:isopentenyl-diphosphate delta-isomerase